MLASRLKVMFGLRPCLIFWNNYFFYSFVLLNYKRLWVILLYGHNNWSCPIQIVHMFLELSNIKIDYKFYKYLYLSKDGNSTNLHDCARLGKNIVNCVTRNPNHWGKWHKKSQNFGPLWIGVVMTVLYWFVRVNVEYENSEHNCGSKIFPAEKPKFVGFVSSHLLNTITKSGKNILNEVILNSNRVCSLTIPFCSKHPSNCNSLKEANPEKGHSRAAIKVHQLERVNATLK